MGRLQLAESHKKMAQDQARLIIQRIGQAYTEVGDLKHRDELSFVYFQ
ncbi:hypothetical protein [Ruegeria arenilitoris]|nr:hypothetical protein [Ruegeria arenilitoris]